MAEPTVTVLMSVYNGAAYLSQAVDSILGQTFGDFEFIIIDDGSRDESPELLARYAGMDRRIVIRTNRENIGLTRSLNIGLERARGRYIARQDADDLSDPERLERQVRTMERNPSLGLLGGYCRLVDERGREMKIRQAPLADLGIRWQGLFVNPFFHTTMMFRRALLQRHRLQYDATLPCSQDYDLWVRLLAVSRGGNLPVPLAASRLHDHSVTNTRGGEQRRVALKTAGDQLRTLMPELDWPAQRVERLRFLLFFLPPSFFPEDLDHLERLLKLFQRFESLHGRPGRGLDRLRNETLRQIMLAVPMSHWREAWRHGLLRKLFRYRPGFFTGHLLQRSVRRLGHLFHR